MEVDRIIQGDCLEVIKEIKDKGVNCIITSPPLLACMNKTLCHSTI